MAILQPCRKVVQFQDILVALAASGLRAAQFRPFEVSLAAFGEVVGKGGGFFRAEERVVSLEMARIGADREGRTRPHRAGGLRHDLLLALLVAQDDGQPVIAGRDRAGISAIAQFVMLRLPLRIGERRVQFGIQPIGVRRRRAGGGKQRKNADGMAQCHKNS